MAMSRFSLTLVAILLFASSASSLAQDNSTVPIEPLLLSHDPRLVALGAWQAGGRQDDNAIAIMQDMVERWDPSERHRSQDGSRYDAMTVILDTLIEKQQVVSPAGVTAIAHAFPEQALILAARLPLDDKESLLLSWYEGGKGVSRAHLDQEGSDRLLMARVAAMMLAKEQPQVIAASVLADSVEWLAVSVPNEGSDGLERCVVGCVAKAPCANEVAGLPKAGWPPLYKYTLEENKPLTDDTGPLVRGPLLIEAGGDRITYRRIEGEMYLNYCYYPAPLAAETRHRLLAGMLGIEDRQLPWAIQMNLTLPWESDQQFLGALGTQVEAEETRLRATVQKLYAKGMLTRSEAESTRPKLILIVFDDREPTQPPRPALPQFAAQDSRTTYRISAWR
jgi:hypothetical protein